MPYGARVATNDDIEELVRLRAVLFESMGIDAGEGDWRARCEAHLGQGFTAGDIVGAVVDAPEPGLLAASGLAEFHWGIPSPTRADAPRAYLSSFSTDPRWRRQGAARSVLTLLLEQLRRRGVRHVELHATPAGAPLYESFGFVPRPGGTEMRLEL